ncbi:MAG: SRPBCC family protein [Prevotella sp.]|jgi:carbon monoxide dehydrogenase subunit G
MKIESSIRQINAPQQRVYDMLSDLQNIERIRDRIPEDKLKNLTFDHDSMSVETPLGAAKMHIVEREEPKTIKFETTESPVPLTFWIQLLPVTDATSKMKLTVKADVNPFISGMVKKPLQEGIEKVADALQLIQY